MGVADVVDIVACELMLFAAAGLLIGGVDDLAIDILFLLRRLWRGPDRPHRLVDLPEAGLARFAILVPAWCEAGVIGSMLTAALARYRHDDYLIFAAAYPNDRATIDAIMAVAERDARVWLVINPRQCS